MAYTVSHTIPAAIIVFALTDCALPEAHDHFKNLRYDVHGKAIPSESSKAEDD